MTHTETQTDTTDIRARVERFQAVQKALVSEVRKVIIGQEEVLEQVQIALFVGWLAIRLTFGAGHIWANVATGRFAGNLWIGANAWFGLSIGLFGLI